MKSSFKEKFDKYELLLTPLFLILLLFLVIVFLPQMIPIKNFGSIFLLPLLFGSLIGILLTYLLDVYWKNVSYTNISDFLKMPTLALILLSSVATLLVTYDVFLSFAIIGFGLGNMFSLITLTSLTVYYRTFYKKIST